MPGTRSATQVRVLGHIMAGCGTHLDPDVVDVLVDDRRDQGITVTGDGDADAAWGAAQTCHEIDRELEPA